MKRAAAVFAAALLLAACSGERPQAAATTSTTKVALAPPSVEAAKQLIAESSEFSEYEFTNASVTIPMAGNEGYARDLERAGWLRVRGTSVELSSKARSDRRFLARPNGTVDVVPLAKKEMGEVSAIRANADGSADADFFWHWNPNEVGAALKSGAVHDRYAAPQQATAHLIRERSLSAGSEDGSAWSVLRITPR